jgi:hypothetical protein
VIEFWLQFNLLISPKRKDFFIFTHK